MHARNVTFQVSWFQIKYGTKNTILLNKLAIDLMWREKILNQQTRTAHHFSLLSHCVVCFSDLHSRLIYYLQFSGQIYCNYTMFKDKTHSFISVNNIIWWWQITIIIMINSKLLSYFLCDYMEWLKCYYSIDVWKRSEWRAFYLFPTYQSDT